MRIFKHCKGSILGEEDIAEDMMMKPPIDGQPRPMLQSLHSGTMICTSQTAKVYSI